MPDYSNHTPTSRTEMILRNMVDGTEITLDPQSAVEYLLIQLNDKIGSGGALKPSGSKTFENLGVPSEDELGNIYNITDDFISNQYFIDGSGKSYKAGTNVYCIIQKDPLTEEDAYWWDIFGASIDLSEYLLKTDAASTYLGISQAGVPNGVATLDNNGEVIELPTNLLTSSQLGIAGGIAELGDDGKVPANQLPASMPASDVYEWAKAATKPDYTANEVGALSASDGQTIALQVAQLSASKLSISQVGVPNGVASLGSDGKVIELPINLLTSSQLGIAGGIATLDDNGKVIELPTNLLTSSQLGIAGGIATLGSDGKVPTEQLPPISGGDKVPGFKPIDFGAFYQGSYIWSDGTDIYYSKGSTQKVFDKTTKTWSNKTWYGRTSFEGNKIWTDGTDYYYSAGNGLQFKLNKETSTWESITFPTFNGASGEYVWWDGTNAQYNNSTFKYTYNKAIQDWEVQTAPVAPFNFNGSFVWTDGTDIYLSWQNSHYVLDKTNMSWVSKTWTGCTNFTGDAIWTDGTNMYISSVVSGTPVQYILDKENSNWVPFKWYGPMVNLYGYNIWTDGTDIYYDNGTSFSGTLYEFNPFELMGVANGIAELNNDGRIQSSQTNYVSAGQKANTTLGSCATAEGADTTASGGNSHAEGASTKATNLNAHAEGNLSTASGSTSHAEGMQTTASGNNSHAEGYYTDTNSKNASHAEGYYTKNGANYQHVEGLYNVGENFTRHEVGNGTSTSNRSNVFEITMDDEVVTYGKNYVVSEKTNIANVADCGTIQSIAISVSDAGVVTVTYSNGTETTYNMAAGHTGIFAWNSKTSEKRVYIKKGGNYTFTFATTRPYLRIDSVKMTVIDDDVTDSHGNVLSGKVSKSGDTINGDLNVTHYIDQSYIDFDISSESGHHDVRLHTFFVQPLSGNIVWYMGSYNNGMHEYMYETYSYPNPDGPFLIRFVDNNTNNQVYTLTIDPDDLPTATPNDPLIVPIPDEVNSIKAYLSSEFKTTIDSTGIKTDGDVEDGDGNKLSDFADFLHPTEQTVSDPGITGYSRVLSTLQALTFQKGSNFISVKMIGTSSQRAVVIANSPNTNYVSGIYMSYYDDVVYGFKNKNGTWTLHQLDNHGGDYVEVTADGIKTFGQLLSELKSLTDFNRISHSSVLLIAETTSRFYHCEQIGDSDVRFTCQSPGTNGLTIFTVILRSSNPLYSKYTFDTGSTSTVSYEVGTSSVMTSGYKIRIYY